MNQTDPAAEFRAMYLAHCEDCERAGLPMPTPEEWVDLVDGELRERMRLGMARALQAR